MNRVKCIISYDGTSFEGYQIQPNKRTVQGEIERVLSKMHKSDSFRIHASGRTDAGVHANGQVFHFDTGLALEPYQWIKALNAQLPEDIVVTSVEFAHLDFHSRFSAERKEYHYHIVTTPERDPFSRNYAYHYPYSLNIEEMEQALQYFVGTHDFTSFCSAKTEVQDRVRTIHRFQLVRENDRLIFQIQGNGFLYNMVRIIIGTVLEVGSGKRKAIDIPQIFEARTRSHAGKTAPGCGLYLYRVFY